MTPTEQDKELLEKLYSIFEIDCDYYSPTVQNGCGYDGFYCKLHTSMLDNAMQLITADRKRVELEARLDEARYIDANIIGTPRKVNTNDAINRRIAELKVQQEEV
jgi:hypothetical protein